MSDEIEEPFVPFSKESSQMIANKRAKINVSFASFILAQTSRHISILIVVMSFVVVVVIDVCRPHTKESLSSIEIEMRRANCFAQAQKSLHSVELKPRRAYEPLAVEHEHLFAHVELTRPRQHVQIVDTVANELVPEKGLIQRLDGSVR